MIDGAFGSIIRADGRPKVSMVGLLIGCITNIILDPIFIFVCHWGVKGAAWATIIGQILNAVYFVACMLRFKTIEIKAAHDPEVERYQTDFDPWHIQLYLPGGGCLCDCGDE